MIIVSALLNANHMSAERAPAARSLGAHVGAPRPSISIISDRNESSHCLRDGSELASRKKRVERNMCLWIMTCRLILLAFDSGGALGTDLTNLAWGEKTQPPFGEQN